MLATNFDIISKRRPDPVGLVDIKDFEIHECGQIDPREILINERISFYAFDFEKGQAVFVETAASPDELSRVPFYYQAQYENAVRVITLDFETLIGMAQALTLDDSKLIFIHSMGRCGSTLASKILSQMPGVINLSEPDTLTQLVAARFMQPDKQVEMKMLLDASIRLLCKTPAQTAWVIKGRSWVIELGDWLRELYPHAKNLYLYRDAESWIKSNLSAFGDNVERTSQEIHQLEQETRGWMKLMVPSIARFDADQHLSFTGLTTLMWLNNIERYTDLCRAGIKMMAIPYSSWKSDPRRTARSMLDYCGYSPEDASSLEETLAKDSQQGSAVSRDLVKQRRMAELFDPQEMNRFLKNHTYIQTVDFEVANSLKL